MLAQQGFPVIYNKLIVLTAAITPRKLVRFTSHSSQLSWSKATQKLVKSWSKAGHFGRFWGIFEVFWGKTSILLMRAPFGFYETTGGRWGCQGMRAGL